MNSPEYDAIPWQTHESYEFAPIPYKAAPEGYGFTYDPFMGGIRLHKLDPSRIYEVGAVDGLIRRSYPKHPHVHQVTEEFWQ